MRLRKDIPLVKYITEERNELATIHRSSGSRNKYSNSIFFDFIRESEDFNSIVTGIIKRAFLKDSGSLGIDREENLPPTKFIVAKIDHPKSI